MRNSLLLSALLVASASAAPLRGLPRRAPDLASPQAVDRLAAEMASRDWRFDSLVGPELLDRLKEITEADLPDGAQVRALRRALRQWVINASANCQQPPPRFAEASAELVQTLAEATWETGRDEQAALMLGGLEAALSRDGFLPDEVRERLEGTMNDILVNDTDTTHRLRPQVLELLARHPRGVGPSLSSSVDRIADEENGDGMLRLQAQRARFMIQAYAPVSPGAQ